MKSTLIDDFLIENRDTRCRRKLIEIFQIIRIFVGARFFGSRDRRIDLEISEPRRPFDHVDDVLGGHFWPDGDSQIVLSDRYGSALFNEERTVGGDLERFPKCFRINVEGQEAFGLRRIANWSSAAFFINLKINFFNLEFPFERFFKHFQPYLQCNLVTTSLVLMILRKKFVCYLCLN